MNKKILLVSLLLVTVLAVAGCQSKIEEADFSNEKSAATTATDSNVAAKIWDTKYSEGVVTIDLTPVEFADGKLSVEIGVNTHSVNDLDTYDLMEIVTLNNNGKDYNLISAPSLSGHHNNGELVFEIPEKPEQFSITITNLYDEGIREFSWP